MRAETKRKLEASGWNVGDTTEFLGLSEVESQLVEVKLALADHLRAVRQRRHMTQAQLARRIRSSQSRVAKIEAGDASVSMDLLVKSFFAAGGSRRELAKALGSRRR